MKPADIWAAKMLLMYLYEVKKEPTCTLGDFVHWMEQLPKAERRYHWSAGSIGGYTPGINKVWQILGRSAFGRGTELYLKRTSTNAGENERLSAVLGSRPQRMAKLSLEVVTAAEFNPGVGLTDRFGYLLSAFACIDGAVMNRTHVHTTHQYRVARAKIEQYPHTYGVIRGIKPPTEVAGYATLWSMTDDRVVPFLSTLVSGTTIGDVTAVEDWPRPRPGETPRFSAVVSAMRLHPAVRSGRDKAAQAVISRALKQAIAKTILGEADRGIMFDKIYVVTNHKNDESYLLQLARDSCGRAVEPMRLEDMLDKNPPKNTRFRVFLFRPYQHVLTGEAFHEVNRKYGHKD